MPVTQQSLHGAGVHRCNHCRMQPEAASGAWAGRHNCHRHSTTAHPRKEMHSCSFRRCSLLGPLQRRQCQGSSLCRNREIKSELLASAATLPDSHAAGVMAKPGENAGCKGTAFCPGQPEHRSSLAVQVHSLCRGQLVSSREPKRKRTHESGKPNNKSEGQRLLEGLLGCQIPPELREAVRGMRCSCCAHCTQLPDCMVLPACVLQNHGWHRCATWVRVKRE